MAEITVTGKKLLLKIKVLLRNTEDSLPPTPVKSPVFIITAIFSFTFFILLSYGKNCVNTVNAAGSENPQLTLFEVLKKNTNADRYILVSVKDQKMHLLLHNKITRTYPVSTSYLGTGNTENSYKTPAGLHRIAAKIGGNAPFGTIFISKINTKRISKIHTEPVDLDKDLVLTRILVLEGLEKGKNKGGNVDSYKRSIYIHGTNEEGLIGKPFSHGCIRMRNNDIIELFDLVAEGTMLLIAPGSFDYEKIGYNDPVNDYEVKLRVPLYLGNRYRRYYGKGPVPEKLKIIWKKFLGGGTTTVWGKPVKWYGTGWPSQGILVEENGRLCILFGALDHHLWKLDALTGKTIWKHRFDNAIKGTCSLYLNPTARYPEEKALAFCGSRKDLHNGVPAKTTRNFRAVSLLTGREIWSHTISRTDSYSRDVDGNGIVLDDMLYIGAENGLMYAIDPDPVKSTLMKNFFQPKILFSVKLYDREDIQKHKNNLVIESSPASINGTVYITSGSGHVYGIDRKTGNITWDFYTGSDIDSTPVISRKKHLFVGIEKEYIKGSGGVFKLNPEKSGPASVAWFFPVKDKALNNWQGGIIGSVALNDEYNPGNEKPALAAFCAIDGYLYVVSQDSLSGKRVPGPNLENSYPAPELVWKHKIGASISTPVFIDNYIIACGYSGKVQLFKIDYIPTEKSPRTKTFPGKNDLRYKIKIKLQAEFDIGGTIESTPVVWEGKVFIGSRNGYFYCLGNAGGSVE